MFFWGGKPLQALTFLGFRLMQVQANLKKAKASGAFSSLLSEQDNETHSANALFQRTHGKVGLMN